MPRITAVNINDLHLPFRVYADIDFTIKKINGIGDLVFDSAELAYNRFFTTGSGRDISIVLAVKPGTNYLAIRRQVARAVPVNEDIIVSVEVDGAPYARIICKAREVTFGFTEAAPEILLDLESEYTYLTMENELIVERLLFGLNAHLPAETHDYTPVKAELFLVDPMAAWYDIGVGSDWLRITTSLLRTNCGITEIPAGASITIDSNPDTFSVVFYYPPIGDEPEGFVNIETACDVGEHGFRFPPNEPMLLSTSKIPSGLSGESLTLSCYPSVSGV